MMKPLRFPVKGDFQSGDVISEILPGRLYMSGQPDTSRDWDIVFQQHDVVISLTSDPVPDVPSGKIHLKWPIEDGPVPDQEKLKSIVLAVLGCLAGGDRILVHCGAGVNRSGLVAALVMRAAAKLTGRQAAEHIRNCRPGALINSQFNAYLNDLPEPSLPGDVVGSVLDLGSG